MHELSLAHSVMDIVDAEMRKHPGSGLTGLTLSVGERAGVELDTFTTAIRAVVKASAWPEAVPVINVVEARAQCLGCGAVVHPEGPVAECPECGSGACGVTAGMEFRVESLTITRP